MERIDPEAAFEESRWMDASPVERAERVRRAGDPLEAVRLAREALGHGDDAAVRAVLSLALLDLGELDEARHALESLLESLAGDDVALRTPDDIAFASHPVGESPAVDTTLAAATAATLELVGCLDDASFERAMEAAEAERELMLDADGVAEQVLRELPPEVSDEMASDEVVPDDDSPFATRTFADLLEQQGHEADAERLRTSLSRRTTAPAPQFDAAAARSARVRQTLERWLENLGRTAA